MGTTLPETAPQFQAPSLQPGSQVKQHPILPTTAGMHAPTTIDPVWNIGTDKHIPPIQYYQDPPQMDTTPPDATGDDDAAMKPAAQEPPYISEPMAWQMDTAPPDATGDDDASMKPAAQEPPHISEPMAQDGFPINDDHQESDEGYATASNGDMVESETETAGTQSVEASHSVNPDDTSVATSSTTSKSKGASTYNSQHSPQSKSAGQTTALRSQSSGDLTNRTDATNGTDVTAMTPPWNNCTEAMYEDSDEDLLPEDANLVCPHPEHFQTFWRADYVTSIPNNTNPILAVAGKLAETLAILQTIDKDTAVYPYESNPRLKPIQDPAELPTLGTELYSYADKNNLFKYPKKEMKTCRLILCLGMNSDFRNTCEAFNRLAEDSQLYPRALNYPRIGRAGFFPMSHPHQMSEEFINAIRQELKRPIGLEWRKAVPSIDLSDADAKPGANGCVDIPAAITVECWDGDEPAIRQRLTELFPAIPRDDRFTYLCGIRMVFIHAYNPKEKDTVLPESRDNVAQAWNLQKSANQRMRTASLNGIVRNPASFDKPVALDSSPLPMVALKNSILSLQVPYMDTRKKYASVFESVEYTRRRVLRNGKIQSCL
jgi:hypothetical protein